MACTRARTIRLGAWDGARDGWRGALPLRDFDEQQLIVDATSLRSVTPTFLLRLRTFVEWHRLCGRAVLVRCPRNQNVANYLARMRIGTGLPDTLFEGLPSVREHDRRDVLIPVTQLHEPGDVDRFTETLYTLLHGENDDVATLEEPISMAVSELCGNAIEHGENPLGCYVAAQRYASRVVLAIGDLGCGVPAHMRRHHPALGDDARVLERALEEGVSGTGDPHRGLGFHWVIEAARQARVPHARLEVRAGEGSVERRLSGSGSVTTATSTAAPKRGTWVTFEIGL
jgi:hypothetical protein